MNDHADLYRELHPARVGRKTRGGKLKPVETAKDRFCAPSTAKQRGKGIRNSRATLMAIRFAEKLA